MKAGPARRIPGQHRMTPRGATRQGGRGGVGPGVKRWLQRLVGLLLILALVGGGYYGLSAPVGNWLSRPVSEISVEGSFRYLSRERVETLLGQELSENFLQLDLARLQEVLEREPWVERASLRRRWPSHLQVKIVEQEPIARWGDSGFLNRSGHIIAISNGRILGDLPKLEGADQDAARMMERYQDLAQLLRSRGLGIQALRSDEKGSWQLELSNGVEVDIGRDRVLEKVQRFTSVFDQQLKERWDEVDKVDLRYQSGVAVSWKNNAGK